MKRKQESNNILPKSSDNSSTFINSIYASKFGRNSPKLLPLKLNSPDKKPKDFYSFQRTLISSKADKLTPRNNSSRINPENKNFRQTFCISKTNSPTSRNSSFVNKSQNTSEHKPRLISSDSKRSYRINNKSNKMNQTSDNFRPPTGFRRCVDEERTNYLNRY